jgi:hypothetical protein
LQSQSLLELAEGRRESKRESKREREREGEERERG